MSQRLKFLTQLLTISPLSTLDFDALVNLLLFLGFEQRVKGSHHIFSKSGIEEIINIQPAVGNTVKPYQAKQIRELISRYNLTAAILPKR